jgi:hypothetical protein
MSPLVPGDGHRHWRCEWRLNWRRDGHDERRDDWCAEWSTGPPGANGLLLPGASNLVHWNLEVQWSAAHNLGSDVALGIGIKVLGIGLLITGRSRVQESRFADRRRTSRQRQ